MSITSNKVAEVLVGNRPCHVVWWFLDINCTAGCDKQMGHSGMWQKTPKRWTKYNEVEVACINSGNPYPLRPYEVFFDDE
jgi:hypothetical protein